MLGFVTCRGRQLGQSVSTSTCEISTAMHMMRGAHHDCCPMAKAILSKFAGAPLIEYTIAPRENFEMDFELLAYSG